MMIAMAVRNSPDRFIAQMHKSIAEPDRALLQAHPEVAKMVVAEWCEAFRSGIGGIHLESALYARPWGFRLQEITAKVHLWHGEQDKNVLASVGHYVAEAIPNCHATFFDNEGHFSIVANHLAEILRAVVAS